MPKKSWLNCAEAGAMYNPPRQGDSIKHACQRDLKKPSKDKRFPGAYKNSAGDWMIPFKSVLSDVARKYK